eukprot:scaffold42495_cov64-Phaeocystis_antarctica.AAC.6
MAAVSTPGCRCRRKQDGCNRSGHDTSPVHARRPQTPFGGCRVADARFDLLKSYQPLKVLSPPPAPSSVRSPARLGPGQGQSSVLPPRSLLPASLARAQLEHARSTPEQATGALVGVHLSADAAQRLAAQPQGGAVLVVGGQADLVADVLPVLQVVGAERAKTLRALVRTHRGLRGQGEAGQSLAGRRLDEERAVAAHGGAFDALPAQRVRPKRRAPERGWREWPERRWGSREAQRERARAVGAQLAPGVPAPARALVLLRLVDGVERAGLHPHSGGRRAEKCRVDGRFARVEEEPRRAEGAEVGGRHRVGPHPVAPCAGAKVGRARRRHDRGEDDHHASAERKRLALVEQVPVRSPHVARILERHGDGTDVLPAQHVARARVPEARGWGRGSPGLPHAVEAQAARHGQCVRGGRRGVCLRRGGPRCLLHGGSPTHRCSPTHSSVVNARWNQPPCQTMEGSRKTVPSRPCGSKMGSPAHVERRLRATRAEGAASGQCVHPGEFSTPDRRTRRGCAGLLREWRHRLGEDGGGRAACQDGDADGACAGLRGSSARKRRLPMSSSATPSEMAAVARPWRIRVLCRRRARRARRHSAWRSSRRVTVRSASVDIPGPVSA